MFIEVFSPMVGTMVGVTAEFVDEAREAADPTSVSIKVLDPAGDVTEPVPDHQGTGIYRVEFPITEAGIWVVQAEGTGAVAVVDETRFAARVKTIP